MRFTQLTKIGGLSLTILLTLGNAVSASSTEDSVRTELSLINACLTKATETEGFVKAVGRTEGEEISPEEIDTCLNPFLESVSDQLKITMSLKNVNFRNQVKVTGSFTFPPSAIEDGVIHKEELSSFQSVITPNNSSTIFDDVAKDFDLSAVSCSLSGINSFSYTPSAHYTSFIKVDSVLEFAQDSESRGQVDASTEALIDNLTSLQAQLLSVDESLFSIEFDCKSQALEVAIADGLADITVVHNGNSASYAVTGSYYNIPSGYSFPRYSSEPAFSFYNRTIMLTINEETLKIIANRTSDRVETSYQQLPLVIDIEALEKSFS